MNDPLERLRWVAAVASLHLPATCYRLAAHLALAAVRGTAYPSKSTLSKAIGCDGSRLVMAFRSLEAAGVLRRGSLMGSPGRQTYEWHLLQPPAGSAPGAEVALVRKAQGPPPAEVASDPLRKSHPKDRREDKKRARVPRTLAGPVFTDANGKPWQLTTGTMATLVEQFPILDMDGTLAKAADYCERNPNWRRNASGMLGAIQAWCGRERPKQPDTTETDWDAAAERIAHGLP